MKCSHRPNRFEVVFDLGVSTTTTREGTKKLEYHLEWCPTCGAIRTLSGELNAWGKKPASQWRRPGRRVECGIPVFRALTKRGKR